MVLAVCALIFCGYLLAEVGERFLPRPDFRLDSLDREFIRLTATLPGAGSVAATPAEPGPVVLNRDGAAELQSLPGIGPSRAAAILELRQRLGRFSSLEDLLQVKGIGPATLNRMRSRLVLDASPADSISVAKVSRTQE